MNSVLIIGAGPAGSAASILFAQRGLTATIIEQHRFPRDKVCGECISALGIDVLHRIGVFDQVRAAGAIQLTNTVLHSNNEEPAHIPLSRPMLGLSRRRFDLILLEHARKVGAKILQPARCETLNTTFSSITAQLRDLQSNEIVEHQASIALIADGKGSIPGPTPTPTGSLGIKSHWTDVNSPRDAIELFGCNGCYGGLAAIEDNRWNVALSVPAERVHHHRGGLQALFDELLTENRTLKQRMQNAKRIGPWLAAPLPRFGVQSKWPVRTIPLGNAAAALEPIGGEGMGLALRSAELAAQAIAESHGLWNESNSSQLRRQFRKLWQMRRIGCRAASIFVSSRKTVDLAVEWMKMPTLGAIAMRAMGKSQ